MVETPLPLLRAGCDGELACKRDSFKAIARPGVMPPASLLSRHFAARHYSLFRTRSHPGARILRAPNRQLNQT